MSLVALKTKASTKHFRSSYSSIDSAKLSEIFNENINISIWERQLDTALQQAAEEILSKDSELNISLVPQPRDIRKLLISELGSTSNILKLINDISFIAGMFCELFDLKRAWIRLDAINKPMCPRFHADKLKCRLVTTYVGPATQWLPHQLVDRTKLGDGNDGQSDEKSGLFIKKTDIEQLDTGHIALLKGEAWNGNKGAGLVHRSPHSENDYRRLYMTIDFEELYISIYKNNKRFISSK
tara:strand:- start:189 stop:908 length:720 start_codon:yes stop_codon:yes gene_type:complete